jgi:hypothetical protein
MLRKLVARLKRDSRPPTDRELAEKEAVLREAEQARRRAEAEMAQQHQRIDGGGGSGVGLGGW